MIDPAVEPLIRLADVPRLPWLPRRRKGKRLHISSVIRWVSPGLRGHRLEALRVGGCLCTSEAALRRFFEKLTADEPEHNEPTPVQRDRSYQLADARTKAVLSV
jgi:hypothetical protein